MSRQNQLQKYLKRIITHLYYFSYILTDNKNLAEKIVSDAYCSFLIRNKKNLLRFEGQETKWEEIKIELLKNIYQISKIHSHEEYGGESDLQWEDVRGGIGPSPISLNHQERGLYFLKEKLSLSGLQIMTILGLDQASLVGLLQATRKRVENNENTYHQL